MTAAHAGATPDNTVASTIERRSPGALHLIVKLTSGLSFMLSAPTTAKPRRQCLYNRRLLLRWTAPAMRGSLAWKTSNWLKNCVPEIYVVRE